MVKVSSMQAGELEFGFKKNKVGMAAHICKRPWSQEDL